MEIHDAAGLKLAVTDQGSGTPVLLLHPFPLDSTLFDREVELLAHERRVLTVDFPGFGQSPPPSGPVPISMYAQALREILAAKKISRADGLGLSLGSYALMSLAKLLPLLFGRLVLVSSRASPPSLEARADREVTARRAETEGISWMAGVWAPLLLRPSPEREARRWVEKIIQRATPQGVAAGARALASRPDQSSEAKGLTAEVLVIHGGQDRLTPLSEAEALAQLIPRCRLETIPGAGHLPNLDEADRFDRAVVSFLGG
jgi:3-oxoadipate enol-lactonase